VNYLFSNWDIFNIFDLFLLSNIFSGISGFWYIFSDGSLYWYIFNVCFLLWDIFSLSSIVYLWYIFSLVFNGIIVGILSGNWNLFNSLYWFIIGILFLNCNIFSFGNLFIILIFSLEWDIFEL